MEAVAVGSWTGTYATGSQLVVKIRYAPAPQPKCGDHILSIKCVTATQMYLEADVADGKETIAMTGMVSAFGSTADHAYLYLQSSTSDLLTCDRGTDHWVNCKLHLHGADHGPFELRPLTVTD
jgi:hypothetical protein